MSAAAATGERGRRRERHGGRPDLPPPPSYPRGKEGASPGVWPEFRASVYRKASPRPARGALPGVVVLRRGRAGSGGGWGGGAAAATPRLRAKPSRGLRGPGTTGGPRAGPGVPAALSAYPGRWGTAGGREQPPLGAAALGGASPAPAAARGGHGPWGGTGWPQRPSRAPLRIYPSLLPSRSVFRDARARTRPSQHRAGTFTSPGSSAAPQEAPAASPGHRGGGKDRSRRAQTLPCASWASRPRAAGGPRRATCPRRATRGEKSAPPGDPVRKRHAESWRGQLRRGVRRG